LITKAKFHHGLAGHLKQRIVSNKAVSVEASPPVDAALPDDELFLTHKNLLNAQKIICILDPAHVSLPMRQLAVAISDSYEAKRIV
jgi:hypothetical protein